MSHFPNPSVSESTCSCRHCGQSFSLNAPGTRHRNHCPHCLWSLHLDHAPGDRDARCGAPMEPIAIALRGRGEWCLIHRCTTCGTLHLNRIAGDDDERALLALALQPITRPPFPLYVPPMAHHPKIER